MGLIRDVMLACFFAASRSASWQPLLVPHKADISCEEIIDHVKRQFTMMPGEDVWEMVALTLILMS